MKEIQHLITWSGDFGKICCYVSRWLLRCLHYCAPNLSLSQCQDWSTSAVSLRLYLFWPLFMCFLSIYHDSMMNCHPVITPNLAGTCLPPQPPHFQVDPSFVLKNLHFYLLNNFLSTRYTFWEPTINNTSTQPNASPANFPSVARACASLLL